METAAPVRLLLVEDNPADARLIAELLREAGEGGFHLAHAARLGEARAVLEEEPVDVVLLDLTLPDAAGLETVRRTLAAAPGVPVVVLTGLDDERMAVGAVQAGAQDYLLKGRLDPAGLARGIRYAVERQRLERERGELLEGERRARAEAEAAAAAREEILRIVSHDLGNSLSAMLTTTAVLREVVGRPERGADAARLVENLRSVGRQMERLRRDLLDVATIEAGRFTVDPEPSSPGELLADAREQWEGAAAERGVELAAGGAADAGRVWADRERVLQVLGNLVGNALKFTPAGGSVTLGAAWEGERVWFTVADTGSGIPAADLPRLFDRFWRVRKGNRTGTGLGLAIARGIVEAHGGEMVVESTPGAGSTFRFSLPGV